MEKPDVRLIQLLRAAGALRLTGTDIGSLLFGLFKVSMVENFIKAKVIQIFNIGYQK